MLSEPRIITRAAEPFAAIRLSVDQSDIPVTAPPLNDEVAAWLAEKGIQPSGAPFFNYTRMVGNRMDMEIGFPTPQLIEGDDRVITGTLPAGRYASLTYTGPYDGLYSAHDALHTWLATQNVPLQNMSAGGLTLLEIYETDPAEEADPNKWVTDIAFLLRS